MDVHVIAFGAVRELLADSGTGAAIVQLKEGATVGDLLARLRAVEGRLHLILVDGDRADLGTVLAEGAEVTLMPPFSGGST